MCAATLRLRSIVLKPITLGRSHILILLHQLLVLHGTTYNTKKLIFRRRKCGRTKCCNSDNGYDWGRRRGGWRRRRNVGRQDDLVASHLFAKEENWASTFVGHRRGRRHVFFAKQETQIRWNLCSLLEVEENPTVNVIRRSPNDG